MKRSSIIPLRKASSETRAESCSYPVEISLRPGGYARQATGLQTAIRPELFRCSAEWSPLEVARPERLVSFCPERGFRSSHIGYGVTDRRDESALNYQVSDSFPRPGVENEAGSLLWHGHLAHAARAGSTVPHPASAAPLNVESTLKKKNVAVLPRLRNPALPAAVSRTYSRTKFLERCEHKIGDRRRQRPNNWIGSEASKFWMKFWIKFANSSRPGLFRPDSTLDIRFFSSFTCPPHYEALGGAFRPPTSDL